MQIQEISTELLTHHPDNPRTGYGDIEELTESVREKGILQPLTVVKNGVKYYNVIAGNRRLEAAKAAGLKTCPCIVSDMSEKDQAAIMLIENMQRKNLTPYEEARGVQMCLDLGISEADLAKRTGFSKETIRHRKKLAELDQEKLKEKCEDGQISMNDLIKLEQIKDPEDKNKLLESIGTREFDYNRQRVIENQKAAEKMTRIRLRLETFAEEYPADWADSNYECVMQYVEDDGFEIPDDANDRDYAFRLAYSGAHFFKLYAEKIIEDFDEEDEEEGPSTWELEHEAMDKILQECKIFKSLHIDFMKEAGNLDAESVIRWLMYLFADVICEDEDEDRIDGFEGIFLSVDEGIYREVSGRLLANILMEKGNRQLREATVLIYSCLEKHDKERLYCDWHGKYTSDDPKANMLYMFLDELGYQMSESEIKIQSGTHEYFYKEEDDEE